MKSFTSHTYDSSTVDDSSNVHDCGLNDCVVDCDLDDCIGNCSFNEYIVDSNRDDCLVDCSRVPCKPNPANHDPADCKPANRSPVLKRTPAGLCLTNGTLTLQADFKPLLKRTSQQALGSELLVRAAKVKIQRPDSTAQQKPPQAPIIFDACAGLAEDAFILAATGAQVYLFEKDPTIATLTQDALRRARQDPNLAPIAARMTLLQADCIPVFTQLARSTNTPLQTTPPQRPDVIYLDPMFPPKTKNAATKKKFQLLHELEKPCEDEAALLASAQALSPKKIVIKRPAKGPYLANIKPTYSLKGTSIRYDCFVQ